jgi:RHS repeat-associated protein
MRRRLPTATHPTCSGCLSLDDTGAPEFASGLSFSPFGVPQSGALPTPFGFTGELHHGGLQYLRARWYDPAAGVFVGRDPFEGFDTMPYSLHPYQYGYSDPVRFTDPSGLNPAACTVTLLIPGPGTVITVGCLAVASILALWATATIIAIDNQDAIADWANDVDGRPYHTGHPSPPPVTDSSPQPFPLPEPAQPGENILSDPLGGEAVCRPSPFPLYSGEAPWQETFPLDTGQDLVPWVLAAETIHSTLPDFNQARNEALQKVGQIDPGTRRPLDSRLPASSAYGKVVGFETFVNGTRKVFRLDYDPSSPVIRYTPIGTPQNAGKPACRMPQTVSCGTMPARFGVY